MEKKLREEYKQYGKGYYHLCLDRLDDDDLLFHDSEDYRKGMASIGLAKLIFDVEVYSFELMTNHLHEILSGTGQQCLKVFSFYKRRISEQRISKGYPPLPKKYGFKLIPILDEDVFCKEIIYLARNPYEKNYCIPGGYCWGSSYLYFNTLADCIRGNRVDGMSQAEVRRLIGSKHPLPSDWELHPSLGLLPRSFVRTDKVVQLFSSPKNYLTRLVKEYETMVKIARNLGEEIAFSDEEVKDIVNTDLRNSFPGRLFKSLTQEEKCTAAVRLHKTYSFTANQLAKALFISELTVYQAIHSKDFGKQLP